MTLSLSPNDPVLPLPDVPDDDLPDDIITPLQAGLPYLLRAREAQHDVIRGVRDVHRYVLRFLPCALEENTPPATLRYQNAIRNTLTSAGEGYVALHGQRYTADPAAPHSLGEQLLRVSEDDLAHWLTVGAKHGLAPESSAQSSTL